MNQVDGELKKIRGILTIAQPGGRKRGRIAEVLENWFFNHVKEERTAFPGAWVKAEHQNENALCTISQSSRSWANSITKTRLQLKKLTFCFQEILGTEKKTSLESQT